MSEDKNSSKSSKTIHVDTLHIKANEVIIHQDRDDHRSRSSRPQRTSRPMGPMGQMNAQQNIQRDFWGFPIPRQREERQEEE